MPDLSAEICKDLESRLLRYLESRENYTNPLFLAAGGSAAVFRVDTSDGFRVFKVFDPKFISGENASADRKRLDIQRRLIDHSCLYLVQTYGVEEAEDTAFIEMEYIDWLSLKKQLVNVPDEKVTRLISQLVEAVKYLEERNIVHRDIKPENIHVSPDFDSLKLLDLGVVREFENSDDYLSTDSGGKFIFLATAQYSSPEYLFRLSEPTKELWTGLNYYQVGAVLHDLIMKVPIFHEEMDANNRWLLARSVLTKVPSFSDGHPERLVNLKSISAKCLTKDMTTRLAVVDWSLFSFELSDNPLNALKSRLSKLSRKILGDEYEISQRKEYERKAFAGRFYVAIRDTILGFSGNEIQLIKSSDVSGRHDDLYFYFSLAGKCYVGCCVRFDWSEGLHKDFAKIYVGAHLVGDEPNMYAGLSADVLIGEVKMHESENEVAMSVSHVISRSLILSLDLIEAGTDVASIHGLNLLNGNC